MKYEVVKGLAGSSVKYACPACQSILKSPLSDAGKADQCPDCQVSFSVPGVTEWESQQRQVKQKRDEAERDKAEKAQAKIDEKVSLERQRAADAEEKRLREIKSQKRAEFFEQRTAELEKQRRQALAGLTFDGTAHDWSTGAPFAYNCIQIGTMSQDWQADLNKILNAQAAQGWEYYRSENLMVHRPQGCLGALLGQASATFQVVVLVFRRPAIAIETEKRVREQLRS